MKTTNVTLETVSPEKAQHWLSNFAFDGQRPLRRAHVRLLASEMREGRFKPETLIVFAVDAKGRHRLIDGQHRLAAVVESGTSQVFIVSREYHDSDETMRQAYVTIDQGKGRTVTDKYNVYNLTAKYGMTKTQLNYFGAAVRVILTGFGHKGIYVSDERLMAGMDDYADSALEFYAELAGIGSYNKSFVRASTLSVGIVTTRYGDSDKTSDYWYGVATGDMLAAKDARKMAREHLLTVYMQGGNMRGMGRMVTPAYSSRYLAMTYNLFMQGRPSTMARTSMIDPSKPINLFGTPFTGDGNQ